MAFLKFTLGGSLIGVVWGGVGGMVQLHNKGLFYVTDFFPSFFFFLVLLMNFGYDQAIYIMQFLHSTNS